MRSNLFGAHHLENKDNSRSKFVMQNPRMLKVKLQNDNVFALQGSMVAYQGKMDFDRKIASPGKMLKRAFTGEGCRLWKSPAAAICLLLIMKRRST